MTSLWCSRVLRALGLIAIVVIQLAWLNQAVPLGLKLLVVAIIALSLWRPGSGLLALAGLGPISAATSSVFGSTLLPAHLLEQLVLAVIAGHLVRWRSSDAPTWTAGPAAVVAAVAVASAGAVLPAQTFSMQPDLSAWQLFSALWHGDYFGGTATWAPLFAAMIIVEGMALVWAAESIVRRERTLAIRVVAFSFAGHAAAAGLTILRVLTAAIAGGDVIGLLPAMLLTLRKNLEYDVNAAAAVFVMVIAAGVGLLARPWWRIALVSAGFAVLLGGLWLTGSRSALGALAAVLVVAAVHHTWQHPTRGSRWPAVVVAAALVLATALAVHLYPHARNAALKDSWDSRVIIYKAGLRMVRSAPIFGVGVGQFFGLSASFGVEDLVRVMRFVYPNENAHNNFLQVLAEQGVIGLAAFLALLGAVLIPIFAIGGRTPDRTRSWLLAGVLGFIGTWMVSHPLLVPQAASAFWLLFGTLAALSPAPVARRWRTWLPATLVILLAATMPVRASLARNMANVEYRSEGLSLWQSDGGPKYRIGGSKFSLYLPVDEKIKVPMRPAPGAPDPLHVEIRFGDQLLNVATLSGGDWQYLPIYFLHKGHRYDRIDFTIVAAPGQALPATLVHVGKETAK